MILGQRGQPQRQLRQVCRHGVLVYSVQTPLGDLPLGMKLLVFIRRQDGPLVVRVPRAAQRRAKLAAGFHQKGARAHGRIAHLKVENLRRRRIVAQLLEHGSQRRLDNGSGQAAGRVVGTAAPPLIRRLEDHCALGHDARRDCRSDLPFERRHQIVDGRRGLEQIDSLARSASDRSHP